MNGVYPSTLPAENLANSTGFSPDETPAQQTPGAPSTWDVFTHRLELAAMDSGFGIPGVAKGPLVREIEQSMIGGQPSAFALAKGGVDEWYDGAKKTKISPDEANQQYPGLEKPFTEPVYQETADLISRTQKKRQELQDWIAGAPELGMGLDAAIGGMAGALGGLPGGLPGVVMGGVMGAGFGAAFGGEGVAAGAANPISLGLGAAAGLASTPSKTLYGLINRFMQNLAVNAGTIAADIPQLNKEKEVSLKDEATGAVVSALGGTAAHGALEFGLSRMARRVQTAIAQHESGANVDMSVVPQDDSAPMAASDAKAATDRVLSPENRRTYEPELDEKIAESQAKRVLAPDQETTEAKQAFTNHMAFLDEALKQDPSLAKDPAFKELQHMAAQGKQESALVKALADCMIGAFE